MPNPGPAGPEASGSSPSQLSTKDQGMIDRKVDVFGERLDQQIDKPKARVGLGGFLRDIISLGKREDVATQESELRTTEVDKEPSQRATFEDKWNSDDRGSDLIVKRIYDEDGRRIEFWQKGPGGEPQGPPAVVWAPGSKKPESVKANFDFSNPGHEAQVVELQRRFKDVPGIRSEVKAQFNVRERQPRPEDFTSRLAERDTIFMRQANFGQVSALEIYASMNQADRDRIEFIEGEMGNMVVQAIYRTKYHNLKSHIDQIYAAVQQARIRGENSQGILDQGFDQLRERVERLESKFLFNVPELQGALAYLVERAYERIEGARISQDPERRRRELVLDPGGRLDQDPDPEIPLWISGRMSEVKPWEWDLKEAIRANERAVEERLETGVFWHRYQGYYLSFDPATSPAELRKGAEQWMNSLEASEDLRYQSALRDMEQLHTQIPEKAAQLGMPADEVQNLLFEMEHRAYALVCAYFIRKVPLDSNEGYEKVALEWSTLARKRLRRGMKAFKAKATLAAELQQWGRHWDGTEYAEYYRTEKQTFVQIKDKSEHFLRAEEVKRKQIARMARMELRPKDDVWRTRMAEVLVRLVSRQPPTAAQELIPDPNQRNPHLFRRLARESWRLGIIESQLIRNELGVAQGQTPQNQDLNELIQILDDPDRSFDDLTQAQRTIYENSRQSLIAQLIQEFGADPNAIANDDRRVLATFYGLNQFFNESNFEAEVNDIETRVRRLGREGGRRALQNNREQALFELGQWMAIRRFGDTIDLVNRDQMHLERMQLWSDKIYDRQLADILGFEEMKRIYQLRRTGEFTQQESQVFQQLLSDALTRRGRTGIIRFLREDERNLSPDEKKQLIRQRRVMDKMLGELLLIKYEHNQIKDVVGLTDRGTQMEILRRLLPGFADAEGGFVVSENTLDLTLITPQLGQPFFRLNNAQNNPTPEIRDGVKEGNDLVPVEDAQRLIAWHMKNNERPIVVNGRVITHNGNPVRFKDLQYWNVRMTYLKVFLDQSLSGQRFYSSESDPTRFIFSENEILNISMTDEDRNSAHHIMQGSGDWYDKRMARAQLYTERVQALMEAYEAEANRVLDQLDQDGVNASFADPSGRQGMPSRSFESIKNDLDLDPQMNFGWVEVSQQISAHLFGEENRLAAHDPNHAYYHTAPARALRLLEDRYGPIQNTRTELGENSDFYKMAESERREYYALFSIAWRHFYNPNEHRRPRVEMGQYTQPYGAKRTHYWLPFFIYDEGLTYYGRHSLPFLESQVKGLALDHGFRGLNGFLGGAVEGTDPRVFLGYAGEPASAGSAVDDQDTGRYIKRFLALDAARSNFFARGMKTPDGKKKTAAFWKMLNNPLQYFSQQYDDTGFDPVLNEGLKQNEAHINAFRETTQRITEASDTWNPISDRSATKASEIYAFDLAYYTLLWEVITHAQQDSRYRNAQAFIQSFYALLVKESGNPTGPGVHHHDAVHDYENAPNAIQIWAGRSRY